MLARKQLAVSFVCVSTLLLLSTAHADIRHDVRVQIPRDSLRAAVSAEEYVGRIEIASSESGTLAEVKLEGRGWEIHAIDPTGPVKMRAGQTITVTFHATPIDADQPLNLTFTFNGKPQHQKIEIGPQRIAKIGKG